MFYELIYNNPEKSSRNSQKAEATFWAIILTYFSRNWHINGKKVLILQINYIRKTALYKNF